jgi:hypothetical protein
LAASQEELSSICNDSLRKDVLAVLRPQRKFPWIDPSSLSIIFPSIPVRESIAIPFRLPEMITFTGNKKYGQVDVAWRGIHQNVVRGKPQAKSSPPSTGLLTVSSGAK